MSGVDLNSTPGAVARPAYMHRTSKVYAIYESEMDMISTLNTVCTAAFSAAGSFGSFAVGLYVSEKLAPVATADGKAIVALGVPGAVIIAIGCVIIGCIAWRKKGGTLDAIKSESRDVASGNFDEFRAAVRRKTSGYFD